jgi:hypothetical protein
MLDGAEQEFHDLVRAVETAVGVPVGSTPTRHLAGMVRELAASRSALWELCKKAVREHNIHGDQVMREWDREMVEVTAVIVHVRDKIGAALGVSSQELAGMAAAVVVDQMITEWRKAIDRADVEHRRAEDYLARLRRIVCGHGYTLADSCPGCDAKQEGTATDA